MTKLKKAIFFSGFLLFMSGSMTALFTWIGLDEGARFIGIWLPTWVRALFVMIPLSFAILFSLDFLFQKFLPTAPVFAKLVLQSLTMALFMDGLMTGLASCQTFGFTQAALLPLGAGTYCRAAIWVADQLFHDLFYDAWRKAFHGTRNRLTTLNWSEKQ